MSVNAPTVVPTSRRMVDATKWCAHRVAITSVGSVGKPFLGEAGLHYNVWYEWKREVSLFKGLIKYPGGDL